MFTKKSHYHGVTLIEMMLAMLITLFLFSILGMIYLAIEKNNAIQTSYRTIQENSNLATQILRNHVHSAGQIGCAKLTADFPLTSYLKDILSPDNKISGTNETLTIRRSSEETGFLVRTMLSTDILYASTEVHFNPGDMAIVSDCQSAEIFKIKAIDKINSTTQKIISEQPLHKQYVSQAELRHFEINIYYVAKTKRTDAIKGSVYALYLKNHHHHQIELVEGIEAMQLTYDVIKDNHLMTLPANNIQDWRNVRAVRIILNLGYYPLHKTAYVYALLGG